MSGNVDIWEFRSASGHTAGTDLIGFHVEAEDGPIGKVDKLSEEVGAQYLVVDTGPWIFGKRVLLPAGTVARIEVGEQKVYVDRTKAEIRNSPDLGDETAEAELDARDRYGLYYGPFYSGRIL
ncbi:MULTISPECIES: PRC-barrel domain-containing protein [unclassified Kitasatospora]|uniref:PRC-barrel domain-containing protein n=1 Tax=unclassified Kitasatospora TaxID=2633591 RepID=UPI0033D15763